MPTQQRPGAPSKTGEVAWSNPRASGDLPTARSGHSLTVGNDGRTHSHAYLFGGCGVTQDNRGGCFNDVYVLSIGDVACPIYGRPPAPQSDSMLAALAAEAELEVEVVGWRAESIAEVKAVLQSLGALDAPPRSGLSIARPDALARVEERAATAAQDALQLRLSNLETIMSDYDDAVLAFASLVSRLRIELGQSPVAVDATSAEGARLCKRVAALDVRLLAYESDCSLISLISSSIYEHLKPHDCQSLLAALRLSPYLGDPRAAAAKTVLSEPASNAAAPSAAE
ncbi:hypothetical protein T492DRAFT_317863 [Pavlovales sp. CCMP2436]|nr:hypothetical protein T492DRAFT_317863 [Pavlovales sp. CCMP2436]|mmetsp:Transcript_24190/g.61271  ORF Transcript_24190/g.61271 Transcript_24190/m.61271 type:complete len:284 (+) Transcript_24190:100-951(+)